MRLHIHLQTEEGEEEGEEQKPLRRSRAPRVPETWGIHCPRAACFEEEKEEVAGH